MTVKYEDEVYEYLEGKRLTCKQISDQTDYQYHRVWTALTQLEQKKLVIVENKHWTRTDESDLKQ